MLRGLPSEEIHRHPAVTLFYPGGGIPLCHLPPPSERHIGRRQLGPPKTSSSIEEERRRKEGQKGELSANDHPFPKTFFPRKEEEEERKECALVWWPPKPPLFFPSLFFQGEKSAKVKKKREGRENPILHCHLSSPLSKAGKCRRRLRCKQVIRKPPSKIKGERGSEVSSKTGFFFRPAARSRRI